MFLMDFSENYPSPEPARVARFIEPEIFKGRERVFYPVGYLLNSKSALTVPLGTAVHLLGDASTRSLEIHALSSPPSNARIKGAWPPYSTGDAT